MPSLRITTLNVAAASEKRARRLLDDWVSRAGADIYVLTETSSGEGSKLIADTCARAGWRVLSRPCVPPDRGVMIISRIACRDSELYPHADPAAGRAIAVDLESSPPIHIVGMYVPNRGNDPSKAPRKKAYLDLWLAHLRSLASVRPYLLLAGDLNVVPVAQRPVEFPQLAFEDVWLQALSDSVSLIDLASYMGVDHEPTWVSHGGEPYTFDHIFASRQLSGRVSRFQYDHAVRDPHRLTDHSALSVDVDVDLGARLAVASLIPPEQGSLF